MSRTSGPHELHESTAAFQSNANLRKNDTAWWLSPTPLNNMSSSVGIIIPIYYGKKCSKPPTILYVYIYILLSIDIPIFFFFGVPNSKGSLSKYGRTSVADIENQPCFQLVQVGKDKLEKFLASPWFTTRIPSGSQTWQSNIIHS